MEHITIRDIVAVTKGTLLCGDETMEIHRFSIDSREGDADSIFVPIIGERTDAHRYIESALCINGAAFTSEHHPDDGDKPWERTLRPDGEKKPWIMVDDTVKAMQKVAAFYRDRLTLPVAAVTGSVGKTTTREMIAAALSAEKTVFQTEGNKNSQIGVPLTLSLMSDDYDAAVLEIGMSEPGQIEILTKMIRPDIAVVTVIGVSHLAQLKTRDAICREKMDIVKGVPEDGMVFLNGDDPYLLAYRGRLRQKTFFYGLSETCDYRAEQIRSEDGKTAFTFCVGEQKIPVVLNALGEHNVRNALAALGIAHQKGVDLPAAAAKLRDFRGQRQRLIRCKTCRMIDDTYNASPDSMRASLSVLASLERGKGRKIAVLSDMLELGVHEKKYHYEVGTYLSSLAIDEVVVTGTLSKEILRGIRDAEAQAGRTGQCAAKKTLHDFESREEILAYLLESLKPEDAVLLKASNGMKLSEVAYALASA